jgi:hypothetical protein
MLRLFCVIVVHCTKKNNTSSIMSQTMELWNVVEMFPNSQLDKNLLILMKSLQCTIQSIETFSGMYGILRKIDEIKYCPDSMGQLC